MHVIQKTTEIKTGYWVYIVSATKTANSYTGTNCEKFLIVNFTACQSLEINSTLLQCLQPVMMYFNKYHKDQLIHVSKLFLKEEFLSEMFTKLTDNLSTS